MKEIKEQLEELKIPYPQKLLLAVEIEDHLLNCPQSSEDVKLLSPDEISEFYEIHNNLLFKYLDRFDPRSKEAVELITVGAPMAGLLIFLGKENFMLQFIRDGGVGMLPILLLGVVLSVRELSSFFRLIVLKDHSQNNLCLDPNLALIGGSALLALGIGATALDIYVTANTIVTTNGPMLLFIMGVKESMGPVIVSGSFAAFVLILHFTTRRLMSFWRAPIPH